jgi:hypothetical protein
MQMRDADANEDEKMNKTESLIKRVDKNSNSEV